MICLGGGSAAAAAASGAAAAAAAAGTPAVQTTCPGMLSAALLNAAGLLNA